MSADRALTGVVVNTDEQLRVLAATFNREHDLAVEASEAVVFHAVRAGEALLAAKALVPPGKWSDWLQTNLPGGKRLSMCRNYMRLAALKQHVDPELSITSNLQMLTGLKGLNLGTQRVPEDVKQEAIRLHNTGEFTRAEIARRLDTTKDSVRAWIDPEYAQRRNRRNAEARRRILDGHASLRGTQERDVEPVPLQAVPRGHQFGEPSRAAVGAAVRRLAQAQGREKTRRALIDLSAVALAWAALLADSDEEAA